MRYEGREYERGTVLSVGSPVCMWLCSMGWEEGRYEI